MQREVTPKIARKGLPILKKYPYGLPDVAKINSIKGRPLIAGFIRTEGSRVCQCSGSEALRLEPGGVS